MKSIKYIFILSVVNAFISPKCHYEYNDKIINEIKNPKNNTDFQNKMINRIFLEQGMQFNKKFKLSKTPQQKYNASINININSLYISNPKITVIVTIYKVENWINECIDSIINQTFKDIEIILVDDGSPDKSGLIIDNYSKIDNRIKVYHVQNSGVSCARNLGIDSSRGKYISFIDGDDYIHPNTYEYCYKYVTNDNPDLLEFKLKIFLDGKDNFNISDIDLNDEKMHLFSEYPRIRASPCTKLYKSSIIKKYDVRFPSKVTNGEDIIFNSIYAGAIKTIKQINGKFYQYRRSRFGELTHIPKTQLFYGNQKYIGAKYLAKIIIDEWIKRDWLEKRECLFLNLLMNNFFKQDIFSFHLKNPEYLLSTFSQKLINKRVINNCLEITQIKIFLLINQIKYQTKLKVLISMNMI